MLNVERCQFLEKIWWLLLVCLFHSISPGFAASRVVAWGAGTTNSGLFPDLGQAIVPEDLTNAVAVAGGESFSMALKADGTVAAWGDNSSGQTIVPNDLTNVVAIAAGYAHALALRADGTVIGWGDHTSHQTEVPPDLANVVAIAAGEAHSLALRSDGTVVAWGSQTDVPADLNNVVAIAAGGSHSLALRANGTVVTWGDNSSGQTNVPAALSNVVAIAAGASHSLALKADGQVVAWGSQTKVPASLATPNAAVISSGPGSTETGIFKSNAVPGNVVLNNSSTSALPAGPLIIDGGIGYAILANGRANIDSNATIQAGSVSMMNWGTVDEIPDVTTQGTPNTLFDIDRFIAVADISGTHFTNSTTFVTAMRTGATMEGVVVVDMPFRGKSTSFDSQTLPSGINVRGTLIFNFTGAWDPLDKVINSAAVNINAADLSHLVATNSGTYTTGYPPRYTDPTKNPINVDITSKGFSNFTADDEFPALIYGKAFMDFHGPLNICGAVYSPGFVEIENKQNGNTQYVRGPIIAGAGVYLENGHTGTSIFSIEPKPVAIAASSSHNLAQRSAGRLRAWGNPNGLPVDLTNVVAMAAGGAHSLALLGNGPPVLQVPLTNPQRDANGFSITLPTRSGRVYALEYKDALAGDNWTALPLVAGNGSVQMLTDPTAPDPQRFYRVRQW
jgi:hypothetical protein